ncbi:MAG TPA: aldo/keto reductase [Dehalococcoidia bacterium]|nr:aldo/keto reductase [Dehalococcoidia bacterium]
MEYRQLGRSGLTVSKLGLGCNNFGARIDEEQSLKVIRRALDLGITFFDTADVYGNRGLSEQYLGKALKGVRQEVIIATKFSSPMGEGPLWQGGSRRYIYQAVHASLQRLETDYIDLYQLHWPDPQTPIEETLRALNDLIREGIVRYIGCSNLTAAQVVEAQLTARLLHLTPFISAQNRYNLLSREVERELLPLCQRYGLGFIPYYPLASGFLTGKYHRGEQPPEGTRLARMTSMASELMTDENFDLLEKLERFASDHGRSISELALGWLAAQPAVDCVIAGATRPEQVEANLKSLEWRLSDQDLAEVRDLLEE